MRTQLMEFKRRHKLISEFDPTPSSMYFVYILKKSATKKLYYGYTNDLDRRVTEHNRK